MGEFLIYGANGYTGKLALQEALRRGLRPIVAGRNREALAALAAPHGLPVRVFDLADAGTVASALKDVSLVLHCAGPFSATCAPMLEGCLAVGAHYLDITGEIDVFAHCHAQDARAQGQRGIVVLPGAGFDVVPTDCVAAMLKRELPGCDLAGAGLRGGRRREPRHHQDRRRGPRRRRPRAPQRRARARAAGVQDPHLRPRRPAADGDDDSLGRSLHGLGVHRHPEHRDLPGGAAGDHRHARGANWLRPLLGLGLVRYLQRRVEAGVQGPDESRRGKTGCRVWGEARNAPGARRAARSTRRTATTSPSPPRWASSSACWRERPAGGYYTPSMLMGADYVLGLPGVRKVEH